MITANILNGNRQFEPTTLRKKFKKQNELRELIEAMTHQNPPERPTADVRLSYDLFKEVIVGVNVNVNVNNSTINQLNVIGNETNYY